MIPDEILDRLGWSNPSLRRWHRVESCAYGARGKICPMTLRAALVHKLVPCGVCSRPERDLVRVESSRST